MFQFNSTCDAWSQRPQTIIQDSSFGHTNLHKPLPYRKAHPLFFLPKQSHVDKALIHIHSNFAHKYCFRYQQATRPRPYQACILLLCVTLLFYVSLELKTMKTQALSNNFWWRQMKVDLNVCADTRNRTGLCGVARQYGCLFGTKQTAGVKPIKMLFLLVFFLLSLPALLCFACLSRSTAKNRVSEIVLHVCCQPT